LIEKIQLSKFKKFTVHTRFLIQILFQQCIFNSSSIFGNISMKDRNKSSTVTVSNVHGMHTSAGWPKQALRVLAAMPNRGEIGSADLCGCRFVKGKLAAQIVDEHWLDDGLSRPRRKTRQGDRLTRTGAVEKFGSEDIGSLHAEANSAAQELAAYTQMRIRQRAAACASQGLDLARFETWTKDCPRHVNDSLDDATRVGSWGC
jgi:hypothetical protein